MYTYYVGRAHPCIQPCHKINGCLLRMHKTIKSSFIIRDGLTLATTVPPLTKSDNLPQGNSESPHVSGAAKLSLRNRFQRHPSQGQAPGHRLNVHTLLVPVVTQPEVGDENLPRALHEDVVAGQVPVHHAEAGQIFLGRSQSS